MLLPRTVKMQGSCYQFFAGAALALDQNCAVGFGNLGDKSVNVFHARARSNQVFELVAVLELTPEVNIFAKGRLIIQGALDAQQQLINFERLRDVVVRPDLEGFDRGLNRGEGRDHDHRGLRKLSTAFPENIKAGDLLHLDVDDDKMGIDLAKGFGSRFRGAVRESLMPGVSAQVGNHLNDCLFVVNDQNARHWKKTRINYNL